MSLYNCEEHKKDYELDCIACEIAKHIDDLEAKVTELEDQLHERTISSGKRIKQLEDCWGDMPIPKHATKEDA